MTRRNLLRTFGGLIGSFALLLLVTAAAKAQLTECKSGICAHTQSTWNGQKMVKKVSFSGLPRTKQNYVTHFHQVRGLPYPHPNQVEVHQHKEFELGGSATVSVQACRRKGVVMIKTFCTSWVSFTVY